MEHLDHIGWAAKKEGDPEQVPIKSFAIRFGYNDRHTAERDFLRLINNPKLVRPRRQWLFENVRTFNANQPEVFWEKRSTIAKVDFTAAKAAADSVEMGYRKSKIINQQHFVDESQQLKTTNQLFTLHLECQREPGETHCMETYGLLKHNSVSSWIWCIVLCLLTFLRPSFLRTVSQSVTHT